MTGAGSWRRRSAGEWTIRLLFAAAAATVGAWSIADTLATVIKDELTEQAHALAPGEGRITALLALKLASGEASAPDRARADRLAREALRQDATAVAAVAALGIDAQVRGDTTSARRLFAYSEKLSRRDLQTQIWAVQDAVERGDVASALHHYDIALRTSDMAPELMFPVLASAIADPAIRSALTKTLAGRPLWGSSFVIYVARNGPDPRAAASLFRQMRKAGVPIIEGGEAALIGSLISQHFYEEAWASYAAIHPRADRRLSRNARFVDHPDSPTAFDWMPVNDAGISTSLEHGSGGGVFDFSAPSSVGGPLLTQMQLLPPGDYRLEGHSESIDQPDTSRPYWLLSCADGHELGRVAVPNSTQAGGVFAGWFTVPAGCPVQTLALVARPSDVVAGVSGQIDQVLLSPAR